MSDRSERGVPEERPQAAPCEPAAPGPAAGSGLGAWLRRWGFSWRGLLDNRRGEWWLCGQLLLIAAQLLPPRPRLAALGLDWPLVLQGLGWAVFGLGLTLAIQSLLTLGASLTPLPEPMAGAALVTGGAYGRCRHPLYQAILISALGLSLALGSLLHLALLLALALVLRGKAMREERRLLALHPGYAAYRASTAAILPGVPGLDWS